MYRTSQPCPWRALRIFIIAAKSKTAFLISLFLFLFTSSAAIACDASKGCLENMTVKYSVFSATDGPTLYDNLRVHEDYRFDSEPEAMAFVCEAAQQWKVWLDENVSDITTYYSGGSSTTTRCFTNAVSCPTFSEYRTNPEGSWYVFDVSRQRLSPPSCAHLTPHTTYDGWAWTQRQSRCLTAPHLFQLPRDKPAEQCWSCPTTQRRSSAPSFSTLNADGYPVSSNNHVLWYSPDACPIEFVQNDPKDLACEGNPIACESGTKVQSEVDYQSPIDDGLQFARSYNSPDVDSGNPQAFLGGGWGPKDNLSFRIIKDATYGRLAEVRHSKSPTHLAATLEDEAITLAVNAVRYLYVGNGGATTLNSSTTEHGQVKLLNGDWTWVTATGDKVVFGANGKPQRRELRGGRVVHYAWQEIQGIGFVLMSLTSDSGRQLQFTYNSLGQMVSLTDPAGRITTYEYDSQGNLITVIYPDDTLADDTDNPRKHYHYEDSRFPHHLTGVTDENGERHSHYAYDDQGRGILSTLADNAGKTTFDYVAPGETKVDRHVNTTDAHSLTYTIAKHNGGDRITAIEHHPCQDCTVGTEVREYDSLGRFKKIVHPDATETRFQYTNYGSTTHRWEAYGTPVQRLITTNRNSTRGTINSISDNGRTTSYSYDTKGRMAQMTHAGASTTYTYNTLGQLTRINGPRTDVQDFTDFTYDTAGNIATVTDARGHVTQLSDYDADGRAGEAVDPNGNLTTYTYTPRGWLASVNVAGRITQLTYDNVGQLVQVQSPGGTVIHYEYDAAHRLTAIVDGQGNRLEYTLDYRGNRIHEEVRDATGTLMRQYAQRFNAMSQLIEVLNGANQSVVQYQYDVAGNVIEDISPTDTGTRHTLYQYDALGRLRQTTDALNAVTAFDFNARDELVQVEDARELATGYTLNTQGLVTQLTSPDTGTTAYVYDVAGNRTRATDSRGVRTDYTYDVLNRLTQVRYPATPALNVTYTYDQGSNGKGRLTRIDDDTGHTLYTYDAFGNVISQTQVAAGHSFTTQYSYNADNQMTAITYPSGRVVNYAYDTLGHPGDITTTKSGTSTTLVSDANYLPFGPATGWTLGNGLTVTRQFDLDYRLTALITSPVMDITYDYDPAGNIVQMVDQLSLNRSQSFGYDLVDRLTDASGIYGEHDYTYDLVGNRLGKTEANGSTTTDTYSYSLTSNRLTDISGSTPQAMTYDATGNIISRGSDTFTYNARNRLAEVKRNGITLATYQHNGKGERVSKSIHTGTTTTTIYFVYDLAGNIIAEADGTGTITREYAYHNERLAMFTYGLANDIYYYHNDHLGTPKAVTDSTGTVVWQGDYTPFGEVTETVALIEQPFRFPGQYFDSETNLHYNYFRDYDPSIGRYIESDPIGLQGGVNTYAYVQGNPLKYSDPLGLAPNKGCVLTYTAAGATVGGAIGYGGGFIGGGFAGTFVGGVGAIPGAAGGSQLGGIAGAAAGSGTGYMIAQWVCPDDEKPDDAADDDASDCGCSKILDKRNNWHQGDWIYWEYQECLRKCKEDKPCDIP